MILLAWPFIKHTCTRAAKHCDKRPNTLSRQSLKMSSQILSVSKCCLKRNILNLSRTISLKGMKFFSWNFLYSSHR